jgi:hypothetical protein
MAAEDDHREILAYIVARPKETLEWLFVRKGPLRGKGLAKRLLTAASVEDAPAAWTTPLGRQRLRNPWRGRKLRRRSQRPSTAGPSER